MAGRTNKLTKSAPMLECTHRDKARETFGLLNLQCLPPEMWEHVLSHLKDVLDLKSASITSRFFYDLVNKKLWTQFSVRKVSCLHEVEMLCHLPIEKLHIGAKKGISLDESCLSNLHRLDNLNNLHINCDGMFLNDTGVHLSGLKHLTCLSISGTDITAYIDMTSLHLISQLKELCIRENSYRNHERFPRWDKIPIDQHMNHISNLTVLTILDIANNKITSVGMACLSSLSQLRTLNLSHMDKITDEDMVHVSYLINLTALNISHNSAITDAGLLCVSNLLQLEEINIEALYDIHDEGLSNLAKLTNLRIVKMRYNRHITSEGFHAISKLPITEMTAIAQDLTDNRLKVISQFRNITRLDIGGNGDLGGFMDDSKCVHDEGLSYLSNLTNLKVLNLSCCNKITSVGFQAISHLPVEELVASSMDINNSSLKEISKFSNLIKLDIGFGDMDNAGLSQLARLSNLKILDISLCNKITDVGLEAISHLPIEEFSAMGLRLEDSSLGVITGWKNLTKLDISSNSRLTIGSIGHLSQLKMLKSLIMTNNGLTDEHLLFIPSFSRLYELDVKYNDDISEEAIVNLFTIKNFKIQVDGGYWEEGEFVSDGTVRLCDIGLDNDPNDIDDYFD